LKIGKNFALRMERALRIRVLSETYLSAIFKHVNLLTPAVFGGVIVKVTQKQIINGYSKLSIQMAGPSEMTLYSYWMIITTTKILTN